MSTYGIRTVALPSRDLIDRVLAVAPALAEADLELVVWSGGQGDPEVDPGSIDMVVLDYMGGPEIVGALSSLPRLGLVQTQTTGYDNVAHLVGDIHVASAAGVHAAATAELALGLTLASLRGIDEAARDMETGTWGHRRRLSLADRRVLIVGAGGIGNEIFTRFAPFEVELTRVGRTARDDAHGRVHATAELPALLPRAEVVVLVTPLSEETHHLVDADFLARMPDDALLVNVGRGGVVDTEALLAELTTGRLHAALDVVEPEPLPAGHPLWSAPNTLLTPHVGGDTSAFEPRIVTLLAEQLTRIALGKELLNEIGT